LTLGSPEQVSQLQQLDAVIADAKKKLEALDKRRTDGTLSAEERAVAATERTKAEDAYKLLDADRVKLLKDVPGNHDHGGCRSAATNHRADSRRLSAQRGCC
jgi:hypothetical protein